MLLGFLFLSSVVLNGQVTLTEEPAITKLMEYYVKSNTNTPFVRAWRIQIMTTNDRSEMEKGIKKFEVIYPHIDYKWEHNPPYYQVRIGAYEKKNDLEAFLLELKQEFPSAIPVQDNILKKELIEN